MTTLTSDETTAPASSFLNADGKRGALVSRPRKWARTFRIHRYEVQTVLIPFYRAKAKEHVKAALWWRKATSISSHRESAAFYLELAKESAAEGKKWAKRLGQHFGKLPKKAQVAA